MDDMASTVPADFMIMCILWNPVILSKER